MSALRKGLEQPPRLMRELPLDERGYPVPYFVEWIDGKPDFRVISAKAWRTCVTRDRCWICGGGMEQRKAFVIGTISAAHRITSEPPSHVLCAEYALRTCPFIILPRAKHREPDEGSRAIPGVPARNPGVYCLWLTYSYGVVKQGEQFVIRIGEPRRVTWYSQGRAATRAEVEESIASGREFVAEQQMTLPEIPEKWLP